jgi:hypothetical protein
MAAKGHKAKWLERNGAVRFSPHQSFPQPGFYLFFAPDRG